MRDRFRLRFEIESTFASNLRKIFSDSKLHKHIRTDRSKKSTKEARQQNMKCMKAYSEVKEDKILVRYQFKLYLLSVFDNDELLLRYEINRFLAHEQQRQLFFRVTFESDQRFRKIIQF